MLISNNKYYLGRISGKINEGGLARDIALKDYAVTHNFQIIDIRYRNKFLDIWFLIRLSSMFLLARKCTFIIQQNVLHVIFPKKIFFDLKLQSLEFGLLKYLASRNKVIIDINDLNYEQHIDIYNDENPYFKDFEKNLLKINNIYFVFASNLMCEYAIKHYNVQRSQAIVAINGTALKYSTIESNVNYFNNLDNSKLKFIYVGTLDRGRQIEDLLKIFNNSKHYLILIGVGGEWIKSITHSSNIMYLGSFNEEEAFQITKQCDIALIPYDEKKLYYNICYPTKNSFYICSGLPVISTPLKETMNTFSAYDVFLFESLSKWNILINNLNLEQINRLKDNVNKIKKHFYWEHIFRNSLDEILKD